MPVTEISDQNGRVPFSSQSFPPVLYLLIDYAATLALDDQVRLVEPQIPPEFLPAFLAAAQQRRQEIRADTEANERRGAEEWAVELRRRHEGAEIEATRQRSLLPQTWAPIDMGAAWDASQDETRTDVGYLSGDLPLALFYRGKLNGIHAESEAGKSWVSCLVAVQEIKAHRHVAYVDFEDDERAIAGRLRLLGAVREEVVAYFHYLNPTGPLTETDEDSVRALIAVRGTLAVFDGMTEAMAHEGLDGRLENDVAAWHAKITKPFAAADWAVVVLDHVPRGEKRVIGSQHKKSALTGVSYLLEAISPIGKGVKGKGRLRVEKDRGAWVRAHAVPGARPQWFADLVIDFEGKAIPTAHIWPAWPSGDEEAKGYAATPAPKLCEAVMGFVTDNPKCSGRAIRRGVTGGTEDIAWAVEWLAARDCLATQKEGNRALHDIGPVPYDAACEEAEALPGVPDFVQDVLEDS